MVRQRWRWHFEDRLLHRDYETGLWDASNYEGEIQFVSVLQLWLHLQRQKIVLDVYFHFRTEEDWDPLTEGLDPIVVKRNIPTIFIYLSLDEIDPKELGYQHSKTQTGMWLDRPKTGDKRPRQPNGQNGNRSNGNPGSSGNNQNNNNNSSNNNRKLNPGNNANNKVQGGGAGGGNKKKKQGNRKETNGPGESSSKMETDVPQWWPEEKRIKSTNWNNWNVGDFSFLNSFFIIFRSSSYTPLMVFYLNICISIAVSKICLSYRQNPDYFQYCFVIDPYLMTFFYILMHLFIGCLMKYVNYLFMYVCHWLVLANRGVNFAFPLFCSHRVNTIIIRLL